MIAARCALAIVVAVTACARAERNDVSVLLDNADSVYVRGAHDSAHVLYSRVLTLPAVRGTLFEARALTSLGNVAYRRSDFVLARQLGDSALALKLRYEASPRDRAESRNALGLVAWDESRFTDAVSLFEIALAEYESAGDLAGIAKAASNLGLIQVEYGRFDEARRGFAAARDAARQLGNARIEGRATTNLAMLEVSIGDARTGISLANQGLRLSQRANDPVGQENALAQIALGWVAVGEPRRALAIADSAVSLARRFELREDEAEDLTLMANLFAYAGDLDRALREYTAARVLYDSLELPVEAARVERHASLVRSRRGATTQAREGVQRALRQHRAIDARYEAFQDLLALVQIDTERGNLADAERWLVEAEESIGSFDSPRMRVATGLARAHWHDAGRDPSGVLRALRAIETDLELADAQSALDANWLRTRAHAARGNLDSAVASARHAGSTLDRVSDDFSSAVLRVGYRAERHQIVADIVLALLRVGATAEAFAMAEKSRGQALRSDLLRARTSEASGPTTPNARQMAERDRLLREIDALVVRLAEIEQTPRSERGTQWPQQSVELARRIREARSAYEALLVRQEEATAAPDDLGAMNPRQVDAVAIRSAVQPGEAVLEYFATTDTLVVFVLRRDTLATVVSAVGVAELENRVRLVRGLLGSPGRETASRGVLERLHTSLIWPIERAGLLRGVDRLLLVPHGVLTHLPFPALRDPRTDRLLTERFTITRVPAANMLPTLRQADMEGDFEGMAVLAPFFERLPATRTEAEALVRLIPNVTVHRGSDATEDRLRRALAERVPVHVATHASFNSANPMFSGLALYPGQAGSHDNGRLDLHEVLDLSVRSPLVFLSGCETAVGAARATAFDRSADVTTLGDAFLLSGAGSVVATLWRIDDEGAAAFAEAFYRHLPKRSAADALALAQRELIGHPRWRDPYYWAAYTLSGDGRGKS